MLLIDDLLAAPLRGLFFVLREIAEAAREEQAAERRRAMADLAELHRRLEEGEISEANFEAAEQRLLRRLESLHGTDDAGDDDSD